MGCYLQINYKISKQYTAETNACYSVQPQSLIEGIQCITHTHTYRIDKWKIKEWIPR